MVASIDKLLKEIPNDFIHLNFETSVESKKTVVGKEVQSKTYYLTRDAFSLVAMGFTGSEAMQWKIKFIAAFNAMEKIVFEEIPRLHKTIAELTQQLLRYENRKALPSKKGTISTPVYAEGLFDEMLIVSYELKKKDELTEAERLEAEQVHLLRIQKGVGSSLEKTSQKLNSVRRTRENSVKKVLNDK